MSEFVASKDAVKTFAIETCLKVMELPPRVRALDAKCLGQPGNAGIAGVV